MAIGRTIGEIMHSTAPVHRVIDTATGATLGTDAPLLHRPNASDTSVEAAYAVDSASLEERVLRIVRDAGDTGTTQDAVLDAMPDVSYPSGTARFSALLRKGLIYDTGERRIGRSGRKQRVLRAWEKDHG